MDIHVQLAYYEMYGVTEIYYDHYWQTKFYTTAESTCIHVLIMQYHNTILKNRTVLELVVLLSTEQEQNGGKTALILYETFTFTFLATQLTIGVPSYFSFGDAESWILWFTMDIVLKTQYG